MCIVEHCNTEGTRRHINFTVDDTLRKYHANVSMCEACYRDLWDAKRKGAARYDVLFRPTHTTADFDEVRHHAVVEAMRQRTRPDRKEDRQ